MNARPDEPFPKTAEAHSPQSTRILFVNRFYWPDEPATAQLLTDLAEGLAAAGRRVAVITSHPGAAAVAASETRHGVEIVRVRGSRLGKKSLRRRVLDFASFVVGARRVLSQLARPGDVVVVMTDPPMLGAALSGVARRRGARVIHWVQDVFPEVAMAVGHGFTACLRPWRDRAWRAADACVTLGEDMAAFIASRGVSPEKTVVSANWAPRGVAPSPAPAIQSARAAWGLGNDFVVGYSGNLGRVHDLAPILDAAHALRGESAIRFVFIGDGAQRAWLEREAAARDLRQISFHPAQPRGRLAETLSIPDLHLVTLRPGCEALVFPSKLYGIAGAGRPVIYIGPHGSEVARLVAEHRFGLAFARHETAALTQAIRDLKADPIRCGVMGQAALAFSRDCGGLARALGIWQSLLDAKPLAAANIHPKVGGRR